MPHRARNAGLLYQAPHSSCTPSPSFLPAPRRAGVVFCSSARWFARSTLARLFSKSRMAETTRLSTRRRFPLYRPSCAPLSLSFSLFRFLPSVFSRVVLRCRLVVHRRCCWSLASVCLPRGRGRLRRRRRRPPRCPAARSVYSTGIARASPHAVDAQQKEDETEEGDRVLSYANIG